jgi:pyruvate dehydrogenase E2 component (dihydrolipoamide acetyltransferase)
MDSGTVIEWLVKPGDVVQRGDIVAVVDTDKADIEIETFEGGTVGELLVPVGRRVPVGTPIATMLSAGEQLAPRPTPRPVDEVAPSAAPLAPPPLETPPVLAALAAAPVAAAPVEPPAAPAPLPTAAGGVAAHVHSPVVRRLAHHLGVDIDSLVGTGPGGAVTRHDVEQAAAPGAPETIPAAPGPTSDREEERRRSMRTAIANLMARSAREIPHYHLASDIDMSVAMAWLERTNLERPVHERLLPAALLLKAVALAAKQFPDMNGAWVDGGFQPAGAVHLGVAISLRGGGLVAPAIHDADSLDLPALMSALRDLVERTRAGRLRSSEMSDPTLTVTSLGDHGVAVVHGLIYPPQVALVGFGTIAERVWASGGMVGARPIVTATLAADHRASDGMRGARFLNTIDQLLQEPGAL